MEDFNNKLKELLQENRIPFQQDKAAAWKSVQGCIGSETPVRSISPAFPLLKWAAGFAILIGVLGFLAYTTGGVSVSTTDGPTLTAFLPDGSEVILNTNTEITYNKWFWMVSKDLDLHGEGFFQVVPGGKFTVNTPQGAVAVLGTSFNVIGRQDVFEVACKTGRVAVSSASGNSVELTPGMKVHAVQGELHSDNIATEHVGKWIHDDFIFEGTPAKMVFDRLQARTKYEFIINDELNMTYSGQFSQNQSIEEILDIVCLPMNLAYDIKGNIITITKKQKHA